MLFWGLEVLVNGIRCSVLFLMNKSTVVFLCTRRTICLFRKNYALINNLIVDLITAVYMQ